MRHPLPSSYLNQYRTPVELMQQQQLAAPPDPVLNHHFEDTTLLYDNTQPLPATSYPAVALPPGSYAPPMAAAPPALPNSDLIRLSLVELGCVNSKSFSFDHPSIPRLLPHDLKQELAWRFPAPSYIKPVSLATARPTMCVLPATPQLRESLHIPLGITLSPFAEVQLPEVDFSEVGNRVIRCRRCSSYINPFTTFQDHGRRWQCLLCLHLNDTPRDYICPLDSRGLREDILRRPELIYASSDFIATPEFLRNPPRPPIQLLALDCSYTAVSSGLLAAMCQGALQALEVLKGDEVLRMGIIGFDMTVYFFNVRADLSAPRMMVTPDIVKDISNVNDNFRLDSVELPCSIHDIVVPVKDSYGLLREVLEKLPMMFAHTEEVGCAFGPALAAAVSMLENNGGKITVSLASLPSVGEGKLKHRFNIETAKKMKEFTMLAAANDWYKQRALAFSSSAISIDLVPLDDGKAGIDLATVAPLVRFTAGHIYRATQDNMHGISKQVTRALQRFHAFDAVLRVRASQKISVLNFYGHCHVREPELLSLPVGNEDSSFSVELSIGPGYAASFAYIQFAILYTARNRVRRIRVHTIQLPVSSSLGRVVNSINSIGTACFLTKMCVDCAANMPFPQAQLSITDRLVAALKKVRSCVGKEGVPSNSEQHLIIAESMRFIPQILNGFFRGCATGITGTQPMCPDTRIAAMATVMSSRPESMLPGYLCWSYQLYSPYTPIEVGPAPIFTSCHYFSSRSVVLMTLYDVIVVWYGKKTNPSVLRTLGLEPGALSEELDSGVVPPSPEQIEQLRCRTGELLGELQDIQSPSFCAQYTACLQGSHPLEKIILHYMVEDATGELLSYQAYLTNLWKRVLTEK